MDALPVNPRSKAHTLTFIQNFDLGKAWDNYGMVGDVKVSV